MDHNVFANLPKNSATKRNHSINLNMSRPRVGHGNLTQIAHFSITVTASRYRSTLEIFLWHKDLLCTDLHSILIIFHQLTFGGILNNQTVHQIDIILQFTVMFESETS